MELTAQQNDAIRAVRLWLWSEPQVFRLFGYAGTGKTTIARELATDDGETLFAAYTGKAAHVLTRKGCPASTIHSLIYSVQEDQKGNPVFRLDPFSPVRDVELLVIDEVSMVGEQMASDLLSFGTKVLVLGDPEQLPPVNGEGVFTAARPDIMLTEVHRQAANSPVLALATMVRVGGPVPLGWGGMVVQKCDLSLRDVAGYDQVIVGKNITRRTINDQLRAFHGYKGTIPVAGERVICLRNHHQLGLLNGSQWIVRECSEKSEDVLNLVIEGDDLAVCETTAWRHHFEGRERELSPKAVRAHQALDFAYAITCHKAQGSQWDRVLVVDESHVFRDDARRWLYTAVTRAAESVTVVRR